MIGTATLEGIVNQIITVYNEELVEKLNFKHTTLWEVLIAKGVVATGDVEEAKVKYFVKNYLLIMYANTMQLNALRTNVH